MSQALDAQPVVQGGVVNQILQVFAKGGGQQVGPAPVIPQAVPPPNLPLAPPPAFLQANALLPTLDDPPGTLPTDHNLLHRLRQTAEQVIAANDYINAPPAVAA